jgi:NAD(P)-dependent dehydrogenase (short-subunit alcohol dehydrogenase family)
VWVCGDLSDRRVPERLVAETADALDGLDALVNNAGVTLAKPALELTADDFDSIFSIDVRAAFLLSQHAARRMGDGGAIVNVGSMWAIDAITATPTAPTRQLRRGVIR